MTNNGLAKEDYELLQAKKRDLVMAISTTIADFDCEETGDDICSDAYTQLSSYIDRWESIIEQEEALL